MCAEREREECCEREREGSVRELLLLFFFFVVVFVWEPQEIAASILRFLGPSKEQKGRRVAKGWGATRKLSWLYVRVSEFSSTRFPWLRD